MNVSSVLLSRISGLQDVTSNVQAVGTHGGSRLLLGAIDMIIGFSVPKSTCSRLRYSP